MQSTKTCGGGSCAGYLELKVRGWDGSNKKTGVDF